MMIDDVLGSRNDTRMSVYRLFGHDYMRHISTWAIYCQFAFEIIDHKSSSILPQMLSSMRGRNKSAHRRFVPRNMSPAVAQYFVQLFPKFSNEAAFAPIKSPRCLRVRVKRGPKIRFQGK